MKQSELKKIPVAYAIAEDKLRPMDVLLWRRPKLRWYSWRRPFRIVRQIPRWIEGLFISRLSGGGSEYFHSSLVDYGAITGVGRWWEIGTRYLTGMVAMPIEKAVAWGHEVDVYRYDGEFGDGDLWIMRKRCNDLIGSHYALRDCYRLAVRNLPIIRFFFGIPTNDTLKCGAVFCGSHVATVYKTADHDLVKNRPDAWTSPSDIAHSSLLNYQFTLVP